MTAPDSDLQTFFAPAGRSTVQQLERAATLVRHTPLLLQRTIDAMPDAVLILNDLRQVVAVNQTVLQMMGDSFAHLLGKRPGELLGCQNAAQGPDGCGTSSNCVVCGAVNAILESGRSEGSVIRECRIVLEEPVGDALDLKVSATGFGVDDKRFTVCVLKDISQEKRLEVLTRTFFHDVINTAGGIRGFTELLRLREAENAEEESELADLQDLADQLLEEIEAQRDLMYAESGDLEPDIRPMHVSALLNRLLALYRTHPVARDRQLVLGEVWAEDLPTDERLLGRVLGNMMKNALEATQPGGTVTVRCYEQPPRHVVFSVRNASVMPEEVQMQIFQRSFSTKASFGRGIGTHSMKLLGERYLGGKVAFTSRDPEGTTFTLTLPNVGRP